jgi:hypothetical protein
MEKYAMSIGKHDHWLLSYYRTSEIAGATFFARLAKSIRNPAIQHDLTKHFADESQHAWYWSECLAGLNAKPIRVADAYQSQYFDAIGAPVNLMEVLAITQIFEVRTIHHYSVHSKLPGVHPLIHDTIKKIMGDEGWHLQWVSAALREMEPEYGTDYVRSTLARYTAIDEDIYKTTVAEFEQRTQDLAVAS